MHATWTNAGLCPAAAFEVVIELPASIEVTTDLPYDGLTRGDCSFHGTTLACQDEDLMPAEVGIAIIEGIHTKAGAGAASIKIKPATGTGPDLANNEASDGFMAVVPQADLAITIDDGEHIVTPGTPLTHSITVANNGPDDATEVVVTDNVPTGFTIGDIFAGSEECTVDDKGIVCPIGDLEADDSFEVTVELLAGTDGEHKSSVSVASATKDPNKKNSKAEDVTFVSTAGADLAVTLATHASMPLSAVATVTNHGPATAVGATLTATIAGIVDGAKLPDGCTLAGKAITCTLGDLAAGDSVTRTFDATPTKPSVPLVKVSAKVASTVADPHKKDDSAKHSLFDGSYVDLVVGITPSDSGPVLVGQTGSFTMTVTKNGLSDDGTFALKATVPKSFRVTSITGPSASACLVTKGVIKCTPSAVGAGFSFTVNGEHVKAGVASLSAQIQLSKPLKDADMKTNKASSKYVVLA